MEAVNTEELRYKNMQEEICQAHMAGQMDAGVRDPSWSNALAYFRTVEEKFNSSPLSNPAEALKPSHNKQSTPLQSCANCGSETCGMRAGFCVNWFPK